MIQRAQTLYLLVAFSLLASLFILPFAELSVEGKNIWLTLKNHIIPGDSGTGSLILKISQVVVIITGTVVLINIFLFRKRRLQMKLCYVIMLLLVALTIILFGDVLFLTTSLKLVVNYRIALIFPLISIILVYLAYWGIKKDDELVRSLDRIR